MNNLLKTNNPLAFWQTQKGNNLLTDLRAIDAAAIGLSQETVDSYIAEVRTLRAWQYYDIFEIWGGALPICDEETVGIPPSADKDFKTGCQKVYDFIVKDLDESVSALKKNQVNAMNQAANRILKARLLLNSEVFIGQAKYKRVFLVEVAIVSADILLAELTRQDELRTYWSRTGLRGKRLVVYDEFLTVHEFLLKVSLKGVGKIANLRATSGRINRKRLHVDDAASVRLRVTL